MTSLASRGVASQAPTTGGTWQGLLTGAGWAAVLTAVLIPIQIVTFMRYAFPETVQGWFGLLQDNALAGLVNLDLLLVVVNVLLIGIVLPLYVVLRPISRSVMTIAVALSFLSIAMYVAINPAIQMLGLSDKFALATSDAEQLSVLAAGQGLLASWEGTAFHVAYIVGQIAGILIGLIMLRSHLFGKVVPYALIAGNVLGFAFYLPTVGLGLSALSGVVLWLWYVLIIPKFFRLARSADGFRPGSRGVEV